MLNQSLVRELAGLLYEHDYTVDVVVALLGEPAHRALGRNSTVPGERALHGRDDPIATLTRLWPLQRAVTRSALERALPGLVVPLLDAGLLTQRHGDVCARIDIRPYASDDGASGWIASDLTPNLDTLVAPMPADLVLGVSEASSTLAQITVREPAGRALDLGTGCGVQSLHLARHCGAVLATDLNPRAVEMAELTFGLNDVRVELRHGNLYAPVAGETFDLITSNPPYVMSPPTGERLVYREGSERTDRLVESVVRDGARHLSDGGLLQVLGNWAHVRGQDWTDRLGDWLAGTGCDAHVVQREVLDPSAYAELWLADAGLAGRPDYRERYSGWLDYFDDCGIEAVGLGWLTLRKAGRADPASGSNTGRTPWRSRSGARWRLSTAPSTWSARSTTRPCWVGAGNCPTGSSPRRSASPEPPTRSTWSSASGSASAGPSSWTPPPRRCSARATATCGWTRSSAPSPACSVSVPDELTERVLARLRPLVVDGFLLA